jgi:hypothetical protein
MRFFLKLFVALCAPITLIAQGYFFHTFLWSSPVWLSLIVLAAHAVVLLGFASLVDKRRNQWQH